MPSEVNLESRDAIADPPAARLGDRLVRSGRITSAQLESALESARRENLLLGQALVEVGAITESELADVLREQGKLTCVRLTPSILDPVVARGLDHETALRLSAIPVNRIAGISTVAMVDPMDLNSVDEIANTLKTRIFPVHAEPQQIVKCLEFIHSNKTEEQGPVVRPKVQPEPVVEEPHLSRPVLSMVRNLLADATRLGATRIHVEPRRKGFAVRFRIDGQLSERLFLDQDWGPACVARLKWLAHLDLSENRRIQEGCARETVQNQSVGLRVATTPGLEGEGVVLQILQGDQKPAALDALGLDRGQLAHLRTILSGTEGLLLAAGPAGSGTTELLYSVLCELNQPQRKLVTLEDPVGYPLEGITQIPVKTGFGQSLAGSLRSLLHQDPDVVLVGEIRDGETALLATQAALSGRRVLSRLVSTTGALEVIQRLEQLGVDPASIGDALCGVVAQRTVRSICKKCRIPEHPEPELFQRLGCRPFEAFKGAGCERCRQTGYRGYAAIRELLPVTPELRQRIRRSAGADALREAARAEGVLTLLGDGLRLARAGTTTLQEVLAATDGRP